MTLLERAIACATKGAATQEQANIWKEMSLLVDAATDPASYKRTIKEQLEYNYEDQRDGKTVDADELALWEELQELVS